MAALLILSASLAWDAWQGYQRYLNQEYRYLESHARIADAQLSGTLRLIDLTLREIAAERLATPSRDPLALSRMLAERASKFPEMRYLIVTDKSGRVTAISDPKFIGFDASQRDYFTRARESVDAERCLISRPYTAASGALAVAISRPMRDSNGNFQGVVAASLDPKYFQTVLEPVRPEGTGHALLVNTQGDILYDAPQPDLAGKSLTGGAAFEAHLTAGERVTRHLNPVKFTGIWRISVLRRLEEPSLIVFVSHDLDEVLAPWRRSLIFRGGLFLIAAMVMLYLANLALRQRRRLSRAQEQLRRLVESSPLPMLVSEGESQNVTFFNRRFGEVVGYGPDEVPDAAHWWPLAYPDPVYREQVMRQWRQRFEQAQGADVPVEPVEVAIRCKNGEERIFEVHLTRIGRLSLVVFVDLTERRRAEAGLRERGAQLMKAQEVAHVGSWTLDLRHGQLAWSDEAYRIFAVAPGTPLTYELFLGRVHPEDRGAVDRAWTAALSGAPYDIEHRIVADDGTTKWVRERAELVFDGEGKAVSGLGTVQDVTERKETELEIRRLNETLEQRVRERTAELEASNRELESFSYSVSHDLRGPLRGIDGFSHVLAEDFGQALGEEGRAHLQRIRAASQRMGELIDHLLDLARVNRHHLRQAEIDLSEIAFEVHRELAESAPDRRVNWVIAPDMKALADPVLIRPVIDNLLRNAWKYTSETAQPRIEFGSMKKNGKDIFFVRDNGTGFDMAYAAKLFKPFQRLHDPKRFEGSGIGLAIVRRIVSRHGGKIWAESSPGQGATFYFTLE